MASLGYRVPNFRPALGAARQGDPISHTARPHASPDSCKLAIDWSVELRRNFVVRTDAADAAETHPWNAGGVFGAEPVQCASTQQTPPAVPFLAVGAESVGNYDAELAAAAPEMSTDTADAAEAPLGNDGGVFQAEPVQCAPTQHAPPSVPVLADDAESVGTHSAQLAAAAPEMSTDTADAAEAPLGNDGGVFRAEPVQCALTQHTPQAVPVLAVDDAESVGTYDAELAAAAPEMSTDTADAAEAPLWNDGGVFRAEPVQCAPTQQTPPSVPVLADDAESVGTHSTQLATAAAEMSTGAADAAESPWGDFFGSVFGAQPVQCATPPAVPVRAFEAKSVGHSSVQLAATAPKESQQPELAAQPCKAAGSRRDDDAEDWFSTEFGTPQGCTKRPGITPPARQVRRRGRAIESPLAAQSTPLDKRGCAVSNSDSPKSQELLSTLDEISPASDSDGTLEGNAGVCTTVHSPSAVEGPHANHLPESFEDRWDKFVVSCPTRQCPTICGGRWLDLSSPVLLPLGRAF